MGNACSTSWLLNHCFNLPRTSSQSEDENYSSKTMTEPSIIPANDKQTATVSNSFPNDIISILFSRLSFYMVLAILGKKILLDFFRLLKICVLSEEVGMKHLLCLVLRNHFHM
jgi:hypothetical protein